MSFRGGGRGGPSAGRFSGGRGDRGGRGRGRGPIDDGPPAEVVEVGVFLHSAEGEMVCRLTNAMIPYFNAGIYLENKAKVGKVEEVFGPINKVYFTIKPDVGVNAGSFKLEDKVFIGSDKLLPLSRFTNEGKSGGGRGRGAGRTTGGRGGAPSRGGFPSRGGGRGPPRGGGRSPFNRGGGSGGFSRGGRGGRGRG
eukprot:gene10459-14050_t